MRVEVMHGVNLDQLGERNPLVYGGFTLHELEETIHGYASELGLEVSCFQTNHEGELVEHLHGLRGSADAAILNAGAWTHYSWAIRDAVEFSEVPTVEVHISDISKREEWRQFSVFDGLAIGQIFGKAELGYKEALELIKKHLGS
jgi:3-dehydroquinate dehydratase II